MSDISLRELRNHTSDVLRRAERGERLTVHVNRRAVAQIVPLESRRTWVPADEFMALLRQSQADPALRDELAELFPGTIDDLDR